MEPSSPLSDVAQLGRMAHREFESEIGFGHQIGLGECIADRDDGHDAARKRSLKSLFGGGRTMRTARPSCRQRRAAARAAIIPTGSGSAAMTNSRTFSGRIR